MQIIVRNNSIVLEDITKGYPGLTVDSGKTLLEACIVTLYRSNHKTGIELQISGIAKKGEKLFWEKEFTSQIDRTWKDQIEATELAAVCISILLALKLTQYTVIERSVLGTGFDYWLGNETQNPDLFDKKARLEISGILKGDDKTIDKRTNGKIKQTKQSSGTLLPAYISVVEFSKPKSKFVMRK